MLGRGPSLVGQAPGLLIGAAGECDESKFLALTIPTLDKQSLRDYCIPRI